jgi:hypothetical protein
MGTKTAAEAAPLSPEQQHAAAKAAFNAALQKTAEQEGKTKAPAAPVAEKPAEPVEPKPAPAKPKPAPKPKTDELAALRAKIAELEGKIATPKPPEPEEEEDPLEPFRAKLAARFGDEEATELLELVEATSRPLREQVKQLQGILRDATNQGRANISKSNQKRLAEVHPQLKNKAAWDVLHASVLADFEKNPKAFESIEDAYDAKAAALYGEPEAAEEPEGEAAEGAPEEVEEAASRIAASAMTAPGRARKESRTSEEKHRELFNYIQKHPDDKAGHRRLGRELGIRP